jgi:hypothetical protein
MMGSVTLVVTGRIWDLIDTRLSELDPEDLEALEVVAVADRADTGLLEGLVDRSARAADAPGTGRGTRGERAPGAGVVASVVRRGGAITDGRGAPDPGIRATCGRGRRTRDGRRTRAAARRGVAA